jgi:mannose-6-phosphate isomerase-like protein (cupin superfamily)
MVRNQEDYDKEVREEMRGGRGRVLIEHLWRKEELNSPTRLCARLTLEPGCSIGFHAHDDEEEVFYIVEGEGTVNDAGTERPVAVGDTILTGGGAGHSIEAGPQVSLVLLAFIVKF